MAEREGGSPWSPEMGEKKGMEGREDEWRKGRSEEEGSAFK